MSKHLIMNRFSIQRLSWFKKGICLCRVNGVKVRDTRTSRQDLKFIYLDKRKEEDYQTNRISRWIYTSQVYILSFQKSHHFFQWQFSTCECGRVSNLRKTQLPTDIANSWEELSFFHHQPTCSNDKRHRVANVIVVIYSYHNILNRIKRFISNLYWTKRL